MYEIEIINEVSRITGLDKIKLGFPPPTMEGDLSTNAAMVSGTDPQKLASELAALPQVGSAAVAGPGFVNIALNPEIFRAELAEMNLDPGSYGKGEEKRSVIFEMVSSNPTGPLHIGHGRGGAIGDSLARMYEKLGYGVFREYYVNDAGRQMKLLGESIYCAMRGVPGPADGYRGSYITEIAEKLRGCSTPEECTVKAGDMILGDHLDVLRKFKISYDNVFHETGLFEKGLVRKNVETLGSMGLTYESEGALWFRSTAFGDSQDRVLRRKDGRLTYFASDCAYHLEKASRFDSAVNIWGADHHGYTDRIRAFWEASGSGKDRELSILLYQLVDLKKGGEKVSMSTREGQFVTLEEVIDEVGSDAARFFMLMRSSDAPLEFDLDLAREQSRKNPVYYVQYSHARVCSVFEKAGCSAQDVDLSAALPGPEEYPVIRVLARFPYMLRKCVELKAPHLMTEYLRDTATAFHKYYDTVRVLGSGEREHTRLALLSGVRSIIRNGLDLVGVSAPERM